MDDKQFSIYLLISENSQKEYLEKVITLRISLVKIKKHYYIKKFM